MLVITGAMYYSVYLMREWLARIGGVIIATSYVHTIGSDNKRSYSSWKQNQPHDLG